MSKWIHTKPAEIRILLRSKTPHGKWRRSLRFGTAANFNCKYSYSFVYELLHWKKPLHKTVYGKWFPFLVPTECFREFPNLKRVDARDKSYKYLRIEWIQIHGCEMYKPIVAEFYLHLYLFNGAYVCWRYLCARFYSDLFIIFIYHRSIPHRSSL